MLAAAMCGSTVFVLYLRAANPNADLMGTWRGNAGGGFAGTFNVVLDLKKSGKGFGKLGPIPEQPLTWAVEENKVILRLGDSPERNGGATAANMGMGQNFVGTLAHDRRSMTIDLGIVQTTVYKSLQ